MRERIYRYDDYSKDNILYPFGFGLTYSDIRVESAEAEIDNDMIKASVTLSNSGMSGQDALEVYFRSESPDAVRNYALCAFTKVHLEKGEKKTISMHFPLKNITVVGDDGIRYLDKEAKTTLYFGTSLPDSLSCKLTGKTPTAVELHF